MDKPDNSEIVHHQGGTTLSGPDAMRYFHGLQVQHAISLYIKTGGRIIVTRGATISRMLALATTFTNKKYKNTEAGRLEAEADMKNWNATMRAALPEKTV